ncbi:hypothetical protein DV36_25790 [Amycolatopsis mediterranei]|nr:hypothetical protein DV36_25790 [Amycolatopsis mediterranei]
MHDPANFRHVAVGDFGGDIGAYVAWSVDAERHDQPPRRRRRAPSGRRRDRTALPLTVYYREL